MRDNIIKLLTNEDNVLDVLREASESNYEKIVVIGIHKTKKPLDVLTNGTYAEANLMLDIAKQEILDEF